jgi:hypothetical protein
MKNFQASRLPSCIFVAPLVRRWDSVDAFTQEVAVARIVAGVHYRFSTEAGLALGKRIGEWSASHAALAEQ